MRWLPMVAMAEVKGTLPQADPHHKAKGEKHHDAVVDEQPPPQAALVPEGAE